MSIVDQIADAYTEAHRGNFRGLKVAALLLTERQLYELRREAFPYSWQQVGAIEKFDGMPVIAVPEGVFYTPRVLMGDR